MILALPPLVYFLRHNSPQAPSDRQPLLSAIPPQDSVHASQQASSQEASHAPLPTEPPVTLTEQDLQAIIQEYSDIEVSLSAKIVGKDKSWVINNQRENIAASTTKLFTASALLDQIEKKKVTFDQSLGSYDVNFQLKQIVNRSNNDSLLLFYNLLGRSSIQSYIHALGSDHFKINGNTLKATDMTNYLEKLAQGELHTQQNTDLLLSLMQKTHEENFIPKDIEGYELFHKNGQLETVVNEAVIAKGKNQTVVIAIYSEGMNGVWEYKVRQTLFKDLITIILQSCNP